MSRKTLTPSSYAVLGLLARRPSSGYELGTRAAASIDNFWPLTRTYIYGELAKLEALGYVVGVEVAQELLPDKRVYSVTPEGTRALDAWLDNPDPGVPRPRQPMDPAAPARWRTTPQGHPLPPKPGGHAVRSPPARTRQPRRTIPRPVPRVYTGYRCP